MGIKSLLIDSQIQIQASGTVILKQAGTGRRRRDTPPGQGRQPAVTCAVA